MFSCCIKLRPELHILDISSLLLHSLFFQATTNTSKKSVCSSLKKKFYITKIPLYIFCYIFQQQIVKIISSFSSVIFFFIFSLYFFTTIIKIKFASFFFPTQPKNTKIKKK